MSGMSSDLAANLMKAILSGIVEVFVFAYVMTNCSNGGTKTTTTSSLKKNNSKHELKAKNHQKSAPLASEKEKGVKNKKTKEKEQPSSNGTPTPKRHVMSLEPKLVAKKKKNTSPNVHKTLKTKESEIIPDNDLKSRTTYNVPTASRISRTPKNAMSDRQEQQSSDKMVSVNNASLSAGSAEPQTTTAGDSSTNAIPLSTQQPNASVGIEARDKEKGFVEV